MEEIVGNVGEGPWGTRSLLVGEGQRGSGPVLNYDQTRVVS